MIKTHVLLIGGSDHITLIKLWYKRVIGSLAASLRILTGKQINLALLCVLTNSIGGIMLVQHQ